MILTTHALVGAAIGEKINEPWLIIILSLAAHFALDSFRHGEYLDDRHVTVTIRDAWWKIGIDLCSAFSLVAIIIFLNNGTVHALNILLGVFFSLLPDSFTLIFWKFKFKILAKIKKFHAWCHNYKKFPKHSPERAWTLRNAANDIIFSSIAIIILFIK